MKSKVYSILDFQGVQGIEDCPPVTLIGNKSDLDDQRVVSTDEGRSIAYDMSPKVGFEETSAKTNINVESVFQDIVRKIKANQAHRKEICDQQKSKKKGFCDVI